MEQESILNAHNKEEYPPMHTAEHILNCTMVKMFGCPRSRNAHIERKKSKCDYQLAAAPTEAQVADLEARVNEVIEKHLDKKEMVAHYASANFVAMLKYTDRCLIHFI